MHRARDITVDSERRECCASCSSCSPHLAAKSKLAQPWVGISQTSLNEPSDTDAPRTARRIGRHVLVCGSKTRYPFGNSCSGAAKPSLHFHSLSASDQKRIACTKISRGPTIVKTNFRWRVPIAALLVLSGNLRHHFVSKF